MIVTIDGSAGSGKSTAARKLAARLDVPYLDTGAMYRAIAKAVLQAGVSLDDMEGMKHVAAEIRLEVDCGPTHTRVRVEGHDVTEAIRTMAVSRVAAVVARIPEVRRLLVQHQRMIGGQLGSFVAEGRDQGTVVFPNADVKFVFEAAAERRAHRRLDELCAEGEEATLDEVLADVQARDARDRVEWAPLLDSGTAIRVDTTDMTIGEMVDLLESHVQAKRG